ENRSEIRTETRTETGSEVRNEPRSEPRNDRFSRGDRPGRGGSDSRFQRSAPPAARTGHDYDYGPPPGYQPMVLPGESISKYQRQAQSQGQSERPASPAESVAAVEQPSSVSASILSTFPEDEPIFAAELA